MSGGVAVDTRRPARIREAGAGGVVGVGSPTDRHNLEEACMFCFDVLMCSFKRTPCPKPLFPNGDYPLFVTWNKFDQHGSANLRGCIGNLSPIGLHDGIKKYASVSAFQDRRFSPITESEVKALECSVTLLYNFEEGRNYLDWQIGFHGMIINFISNGEAMSATYLPSVCSDQGWDHQECIKSLVRKAGHTGSVSQSLLNSIRLTRYQGTKATVDFERYAGTRKGEGLWHPAWGS